MGVRSIRKVIEMNETWKKIDDVLFTQERVDARRRIDPDDAEAWDAAFDEWNESLEEGYFEARFGKDGDDEQY